MRSELHNSHQREDMRDAPRPCATRDYSSTFSEEGDQNDQLLWQCAQPAALSDVGRTWAVVREDSKPENLTSLKLLSIDPLFALLRTCEHLSASHPLPRANSHRLWMCLQCQNHSRRTCNATHGLTRKKHTETKTYRTERSKFLPITV